MLGRWAQAASTAVVALSVSGCMGISPQLHPTNYEELETLSDRDAREAAYADNAIYVHDEPQGKRYTKGTHPHATKRSWQSLDVVLRSDKNAAAALPKRSLRLSRIFTALTIASGILTVAGVAASAREGLDLKDVSGPAGVLLGGGIATVGFGITAGIFYGRTRKGYESAVALYNDSLAVRLGLNTPAGAYIPPAGTLVDEEGFVVLDERERAAQSPPEDDVEPAPPVAPGPQPAPADAATPLEAPAPAEPSPTEPPPAEAEPAEPAEPAPEPPPPVRRPEASPQVPTPPPSLSRAGSPTGSPVRPLALLPSR
jgi:hypothetical protein